MFPSIDSGSLIASVGVGFLVGLLVGLTTRFLHGLLMLALAASILGIAYYRLNCDCWLVNAMADPAIPGVHWYYFAISLGAGIAVHGVDRLTRPVGYTRPV